MPAVSTGGPSRLSGQVEGPKPRHDLFPRDLSSPLDSTQPQPFDQKSPFLALDRAIAMCYKYL
jgi:hypothetical protein